MLEINYLRLYLLTADCIQFNDKVSGSPRKDDWFYYLKHVDFPDSMNMTLSNLLLICILVFCIVSENRGNLKIMKRLEKNYICCIAS